MKRFRKNAKTGYFVLTLVLILLSLGCASVRVLNHDPSKAAIEAENCADVAFKQYNPQKAFDTLSDKMKKYYSMDEFTSTIAKMHPTGYSSKVSALEYEPIPGEPAMNIYL